LLRYVVSKKNPHCLGGGKWLLAKEIKE